MERLDILGELRPVPKGWLSSRLSLSATVPSLACTVLSRLCLSISPVTRLLRVGTRVYSSTVIYSRLYSVALVSTSVYSSVVLSLLVITSNQRKTREYGPMTLILSF